MSSSQTPHATAPGGHGHAPPAGGMALIIGAIGVAFWALNIVVTLKYVTIIMRADNDGEGGIMALMALTQRTLRNGSRSAYVVGILGIFGASLFFGDGVITPAISVLGAVEGLEVAAPGLHAFIVPITVVVLLMVFAAQRFGTEKIGKAFGPITSVWFISLAAIGIYNIVDAPEVLKAFNPWWAIRFFMEHGWHGIFILGAVVLAVTGGEALYADMGHFGAKPIRHAWYFFVLPCLVLNYLGQGALVLNHPEALKNPFFEAVPPWALYPMIILATMAAVIASQSVITGAFSVSRQAMQLGYIPRMRISHDTIGQIYIPGINWGIAVMVIGLVLAFRSSSNLAVAYGISVSATMLIDTLLLALVARSLWPKARAWILPLCVVFFIIDLGFVIANGAKLLQGAWFPVVLGIFLFTRARHRGVPHRRPDRGPARADAQPQAQQGAARAQRVPARGDAAGAVCAGGAAAEDRIGGRRVLPGLRAFRLHGDPGRAAGADALVRPRRHLFRPDGHHLLRQPRDHRGHRQPRHADLARQAVRADASQRRPGDGLLPHSGQSLGRAGRAGGDLTAGVGSLFHRKRALTPRLESSTPPSTHGVDLLCRPRSTPTKSRPCHSDRSQETVEGGVGPVEGV
jgi:K+ potassium transporter